MPRSQRSITTRSNLIRLIAVACLRAPREPLAVGRVLRAVVAAGAGGDLHGFRAGLVELEGEDVVVGGLAGLREDAGLGEADLEVGDVGDLVRVGSPGVAERAAEGEGWRLGVADGGARREVAEVVAVGVDDGDVAAAFAGEVVPVAIEE